MVYLTDLISVLHLESFYFIAIDLLVALYLVLIARRKCPAAVESVAAAYLLNPLMLLSCAARSSSGLVHLTLVGAVYHAMVGELFETILAGLFAVSWALVGTWRFMLTSHGSRLLYENLKPNVGLYWYLFVEMFDFFRPLFVAFLQIHSLFYAFPVAIKFKYLDQSLQATVPTSPHFVELRVLYANIVVMLFVSVLAPVNWYFWVHQGSGNVNFYYATTLVYNIAHVVLIVDMLRTHAKEALAVNEVPIGCVIVDPTGKIVAKGRNRTNETRNATRHAEFEALDTLLSSMDASEVQEKMSELSLYVTIEPCIMCAAALRRVGLLRVYFGSYNERFGGCGSIIPVHNSYLVDPPLEVALLVEWRAECVGLLRMFYMRENERAPMPRKKSKRVLKPVL
ncbi:hypothetical protein PSACC_01228 [Paramicrosporidium saccamoebae]|uniref:CMP/dCMP-type deaminase domain-containing protein n=1 Tax=Paramicrosporidium saccamoebae TaxID=1246581 RepID=A0A2H9TMH3_9FUNG|nr:hypothetical protein PSACC_01228 [Paramicrosporidium saccamoebae]